MAKGNVSTVGEEKPTNETKETMDSLTEEILGAGKAPEPAETGLEGADEEGDAAEGLEGAEGDAPEGDGEAENAESEDAEEVIPRSKHQKVLEKQQRRIDELTNKIKQFEARETKKPETQLEKLEALSTEDLESLLDNTTDTIAEAKYKAAIEGVDVTQKLTDLQTLRRNIRQTMKDAPNRFARKQTEILETVVGEVKDLDPDVTSRKGKLWELATRIYTSSPSLQKTVTGQGEAMRLAAEHLLAIQQSAQGLEKVSDLTKKVNSLKRKTTLDGNVRRGNEQTLQTRKIREKALNGTFDDKMAFVKTLIPDDFLNQGS